jgi:DNA helicase-2/ATP-dependent DNA helicase PcrA
MNELERKYELERLQTIISLIKRLLAVGANYKNDTQIELRNTLGDYWENAGREIADEAQLIEVVERQRSITTVITDSYQQLKRIIDSPYFGRIDFKEVTPQEIMDSEKIYIGISTLTDPANGDLLIYDWRSPIAGMFYDFERGSAFYNCPSGTISGTISLKRQYKIVNSIMKYMFDSDLKIDDEILQELLGKSADDKMHSIVTSIQREQNQVIRNEGHRLLFVQGPAGSGKTSIALHRVAYLLYRDKETLTAKNVLILSPHHIFSDYISNVLPEIGEENVLHTTFHDYITSSMSELPILVENRSDHLEFLLTNHDSPKLHNHIANISYKSSDNFESVLRNFLHYLDKDIILTYPPIIFREQVIFSQEDWQEYYLTSLSFLPVKRRLIKIQELIFLRMRPLVHKIRQEKEAEIVATAEEVNEKTIQVLARIAAKEELAPLVTKIENLTSIDSFALYQQLFEDEELFHRHRADTQIPPHWLKIKKHTLSKFRSGLLPYEDSFPFFYFQGILEGFPTRLEIKHLMIDEAQDYTALQYKILTYLFPNCSWTVLGDPAQIVHPFLPTVDFKAASHIINLPNPIIFRLTQSYRSTREIQSFCQALLPTIDETKSIHRSGTLPRVIHIQSQHLVSSILNHEIKKLQEEGWHSIAIICKTAHDCTIIYDQLKTKTKLTLISTENDEYHRGIIVIPAYLAKGLEFDAVFVLNVDAGTYGFTGDANILYTICTRALHRLSLFYSGSLSPLITNLAPNLYQFSTEESFF